MVESDASTWSPEDTLRILIASDIHLGYMENDAVRGEDSFIAFEEVLSLAVQYDVDLVLLGGDLFDHSKPSPSCMYKCTEIIRKYCFGDKPVHVELLSDQLENFSRNVNYEDPNLNVSYPILSIHGNHDDPVGQGSISSLDILSISGLVNYFGKWTDYTHVNISPVLMQKGATRLALYGLSHLKDQRLSRLLEEKKVEMDRPDESLDWFNLLVLHQNRADRGPRNYIREDVLPKFLDLVVWGHEHDSQMIPMHGNKTEKDSFFVVQPGSTVATSLAAGEALPKHCGLLQIHKGDFILKPLPLKTVRPFIFKTIVLSEENLAGEEVNETEKVQEFLKRRVEEAIEEAAVQRSGDPRQPAEPLVRISVFYEHEGQNFNLMRFGQNFNGAVANPNDVLLMKREKKVRERKQAEPGQEADLTGVAAKAPDVEALLREYFLAQPPERRLGVLSVRVVTEAVRDFTMKKNDDVFRRAFDAHKRRAVAALLEAAPDAEDDITECLRACKAELDATPDDRLPAVVDTSVRAAPQPPKLVVPIVKLPPQVTIRPVSSSNSRKAIVVLSSDDDDEPIETTRAKGARGRGRGAAPTPRGGRSRARGGRTPARAAPPPREPSPPAERRTPRRAAAQKSNSWLQNLVGTRKLRNISSDIEDSD